MLELTGVVPVGTVDTLEFATRDPVHEAAAALHRSIVEHGIAVDAGWRVAWDPGEPLGGGCMRRQHADVHHLTTRDDADVTAVARRRGSHARAKPELDS